MATPPPLPPSQPPPLPSERRKIPTFVYLFLFILLFAIDAALAYQRAVARVPGNLAYAIGVVQGSVLLPLVVVAGVACISKQNRDFRGIIRVLFWGAVFLLFVKLNQVASSTRPRPEEAPRGNAVLRLRRADEEAAGSSSKRVAAQSAHGMWTPWDWRSSELVSASL